MKDISQAAYEGSWNVLFDLLGDNPQLINEASEPKGYTPLHQAAWHGASPSIIGHLLELGAHPWIRTNNKKQTAQEIAKDKHPERDDLFFLLYDRGLTVSQLMRKAVAENNFFDSYDSNQVIYDLMLELFNSLPCRGAEGKIFQLVGSTYKTLSGVNKSIHQGIGWEMATFFDGQPTESFWSDTVSNILERYLAQDASIPIQRHWAGFSDLFDPVPSFWGTRGDPYLWLEMRQSLCHLPWPQGESELIRTINSSFDALTGRGITELTPIRIDRFNRGGMSSGYVSAKAWRERFIPIMVNRWRWLQESWAF